MANPNRCMAHAHRVQSSDYATYRDPRVAARVAGKARQAGFKVRESRFRMGPRGKDGWFVNRVSVYWNDGDARPDFAAWEAAVRAEMDA